MNIINYLDWTIETQEFGFYIVSPGATETEGFSEGPFEDVEEAKAMIDKYELINKHVFKPKIEKGTPAIHDDECIGYHTSCVECTDDNLNICVNEFGAADLCRNHKEDE